MNAAENVAPEAQEIRPMRGELPRESPTLGKLAEALSKAQGAMESAAKDSTNPHFKSRYADLASVRDAIRKPLADNGLAYFQRTSSRPGGVHVETTLVHVSGEYVRDSCWLPVATATPQAYGSAITYARRYSLAALVGVAADEDDDGNAGSGKLPPPRAPVQTHVEPVSQEEPQRNAEGAPQAPDPVIGFGRDKGKRASQLSDKELLSLVAYLNSKLPGSKPEFYERNAAQLREFVAHAESRGLTP